MKRRTVVWIAVVICVLLAAGTVIMIPLVARAREIAVENARQLTLRDIGTNLQLYADTRVHGDVDWATLLEKVRGESPGLFSARDFGDGRVVTYELIGPKESIRSGDASKVVVVRDHVEQGDHRSAALFADGHVTFDE